MMSRYPIHYCGRSIPFWKAYRLWLAPRGVFLYDIQMVFPSWECWYAPDDTTSSPLPFAIRFDKGTCHKVESYRDAICTGPRRRRSRRNGEDCRGLLTRHSRTHRPHQ
ncbi:hypothetical protein C8Q76DRAFT_37478 [Earliella scabrosa]|nr:hypothetical protein C8Q76DRAFT_37478 [Earliella scabrosa]